MLSGKVGYWLAGEKAFLMHATAFPSGGFHNAFLLVMKWKGGRCLTTVTEFVNLHLKSDFQANVALDHNPCSKFILKLAMFGLKLTFAQ